MKFAYNIYKFLICIFIFLLPSCLVAQVSITNDNTEPDASAMLDVKSTDKGLLIPRMTDAQRVAIVNPAKGLMVYDSTAQSFWYFNGMTWVNINADNDPTNEIELPSGGNSGQFLQTNGAGTVSWQTPTDNVNDADADPTNEIELPAGGTNGQILSTNGAGTVSWVNDSIDNLGNHMATQNIQLNNHWLTNGTSNNGLKINDIGAVSIESTSARTLLGQSTTAGASNYLELNNSAGTRALFGPDGNGYSGGDTMSVAVANWSNGDLNFFSNATKRMSINKTGNIAIGRDSALYKLHVNGKVKAVDSILTDVAVFANGTISAKSAGNALQVFGANGSLNVALREEYANAGGISLYNSAGAERMAHFIDGGTDVGAMFVYGPNSSNFLVGNLSGKNDHGFIAVVDSLGSPDAGMYIDAAGNGIVYGTTKNFRVDHPKDKTKEIWYACIEGPEAAIYVRGTAQLENGKATIPFPEHFAALAIPSSLTVTLTPNSGQSKGLAVVNKTANGFEVEELWSGNGTYAFDWVAMAVRVGQEKFEPVRDKATMERLLRPRSVNK